MSIIAPVIVSLVTVSATLIASLFVTSRVTDRWDQVKKNREMNLAAAHDFQRLYGEIIAIWKTWNALNGRHTAHFATPEDAKWDTLKRATAAEGEIEALMARLAAERTLNPDDLDMLGSLRQAFKVVRRTIRADQPLSWTADNIPDYAAFKKLTSAMSVLLSATTPIESKPLATEAATAFQEITANRHEATWIDSASRLVPLTPIKRPHSDGREQEVIHGYSTD